MKGFKKGCCSGFWWLDFAVVEFFDVDVFEG